MDLAKIPAYLVVVNEPLPFDVFDSNKKLLLSRGHVVGSDQQRESLLERGLFAEVDAIKKATANQKASQTKVADAFTLWDGAFNRLNALLRTGQDDPLFSAKLSEIATIIQMLASKQGDATICAMMLADMQKYAVMHCLQCALVCALVSNRLEWAEPECHAVVCAALTMNVSMLELQTQLLKQNGPLAHDQATLVQEHPVASRVWLEQAGVTNELWLRTVELHHETESGTGYPRKLHLTEPLPLLLGVVDTFCAKISPRQYRKPMLVNSAAKSLLQSMTGGAGSSMVASILKEMGFYPPGTLLKLASGETALALKRGGQPGAPVVAALCNTLGIAYATPLQRDTSKALYAVKSVVSLDSSLVRFDVRRLYGFKSTHTN